MGLMIFIGAFLGLIFLTATGSVIFFKQLSEANDDKIRYKVLKNIGVNKKEIKMSIAKQMLFVFLLPLLVGAAHSCVAITLLGKILGSNLMVPIFVTIGIYSVIYLVYYFITVNACSRIINSNS
jgi:putative ABC transport system permease protein